ncbi:MAG: hypothetical protein SCALA702_15590 [Melioribacteraceae bacterium]|nr:MAG: hypothetical protein SCALA702_15590 [Melioribacteraceae bacterium]
MKRVLLFFIFLSLLFTACEEVEIENESENFKFRDEVTLPGSTVEIYDAITGDISGWWDHSFSENPYKFYIEAKPGGGFYEIFDESGDGVKHAEVTYAKRGEILRFEGPLGLSGRAIHMVTSYYFESVGTDSTLLAYEVHGSGEVEDKTSKIVEGVWKHFIFERFVPYINEGKHKIKSETIKSAE